MKAIEKVAEEFNVSEQEVENEISKAILEARKSSDEDTQKIWQELFPNGKEPSPTELIEALTNVILTEIATINI